VAEEERQARGLDMELDLARERPLGERFTTSWTLGYHHSRTEPQYRSVAAFVQADREDDRFELAGMLGPAALQMAHGESRDNLDDIPSILTTRSDTDVATLAVPLGQLRSEPSVWLPLLSYSLERTHQKGDGVPVDSGFSESHVPDQVSRNHNASLDWSGGVWRFGYRFNRSEQDNRQPGRERADFETRVHALAGAFGLARLDLGFDLSEEDSRSFEFDQRGETRRYGLNLLWRTSDRLTWNGTLVRVRSETDPATDESESWDGDLQLTLRLGPWGGDRHGISSQLHLRYTSSQLNLANPLFGFVEDRRTWALRSGLSLSVF
jgi:hypothetical protein